MALSDAPEEHRRKPCGHARGCLGHALCAYASSHNEVSRCIHFRPLIPCDLRVVAMGVPKEDLVLGLQPVYAREYTGYGVA
ncbi:XisI protein [Scytonema sp. HK-05]|nr:XisI protein [Scytonema sp. HK-05]